MQAEKRNYYRENKDQIELLTVKLRIRDERIAELEKISASADFLSDDMIERDNDTIAEQLRKELEWVNEDRDSLESQVEELEEVIDTNEEKSKVIEENWNLMLDFKEQLADSLKAIELLRGEVVDTMELKRQIQEHENRHHAVEHDIRERENRLAERENSMRERENRIHGEDLERKHDEIEVDDMEVDENNLRMRGMYLEMRDNLIVAWGDGNNLPIELRKKVNKFQSIVVKYDDLCKHYEQLKQIASVQLKIWNESYDEWKNDQLKKVDRHDAKMKIAIMEEEFAEEIRRQKAEAAANESNMTAVQRIRAKHKRRVISFDSQSLDLIFTFAEILSVQTGIWSYFSVLFFSVLDSLIDLFICRIDALAKRGTVPRYYRYLAQYTHCVINLCEFVSKFSHFNFWGARRRLELYFNNQQVLLSLFFLLCLSAHFTALDVSYQPLSD